MAPAVRLAVTVLASLFLLALSGEAGAHGRSVSYSSWQLDERGAEVRAELSELDASALRASGVEGDLGSFVARSLRLEAAGATCDASEVSSLGGKPGWLRFQWRLTCPGGERRIVSDLMFDLTPGHLHFAELRLEGVAAEHAESMERVLSELSRSASAQPEAPPTLAETAGRYFDVGLEHIAGGWDHLVFLFALALIARRLRSLLLVATGFTLGHSVTLAAAVLGEVRAALPTVEAMIGLSIALVAAENAWLAERRDEPPRRDRTIPVLTVVAIAASVPLAAWRGAVSSLTLAGAALFAGCYFAWLDGEHHHERARATVAALFGLVHGFGFAGALTEAELPASRLGAALFGFNLGVEIGQLLFVAAIFALVTLVRRRGGEGAHDALIRWGSAAAAAAGTFWFVTRTWG